MTSQAIDKWSGKPLHCQYQALIVAIATRHADAVDIKFLVEDRPVWIALPHPAWVEYNQQTGKVITDPMAVQIAGHYLKWAIESGEDSGREMYSLTVAGNARSPERAHARKATTGCRRWIAYARYPGFFLRAGALVCFLESYCSSGRAARLPGGITHC